MKRSIVIGSIATCSLIAANVFLPVTVKNANAQSFSCANAQIPSEMAVCNNELLLIKDEKLAELLADAIIRATGSDRVQKISAKHGSWLKQRNLCRLDFECLETRYDERIRELKRDSEPLQTASVSDRF